MACAGSAGVFARTQGCVGRSISMDRGTATPVPAILPYDDSGKLPVFRLASRKRWRPFGAVADMSMSCALVFGASSNLLHVRVEPTKEQLSQPVELVTLKVPKPAGKVSVTNISLAIPKSSFSTFSHNLVFSLKIFSLKSMGFPTPTVTLSS